MRPRWAAPDHASLVTAAVDVASADGLEYLGRLLASSPAPGRPPFIAHVARGAVDADYPGSGGYVLHLYHFHHPWTHLGYAGCCSSAAQVTNRLFLDGLALWTGGRREEAAYELGRACHPLIDVWVPYHAAGVAGCGHGPYEAWLTEDGRWRDYVPGRGGRYSWQAVYRPGDGGPPHILDSRSPPHWVDLAAHESWAWYRDGLNGCANRRYQEGFAAAAEVLVPGTVRYLAGFLHAFFTLAGEAPVAATPVPATSVAGTLVEEGTS